MSVKKYVCNPVKVTRKHVAQVAGISERRVFQMQEEGILPAIPKGTVEFDAVEVFTALVAYVRETEKAKPTGEGNPLKDTQLKILQLKHAKESGELVGVGEVKDQFASMTAVMEKVLRARMGKKEYNAAIEELKSEWQAITGAVVF